MSVPRRIGDLPEFVVRTYTEPKAADLTAQWLDMFGTRRRSMNTKDFLWHVFSGARHLRAA